MGLRTKVLAAVAVATCSSTADAEPMRELTALPAPHVVATKASGGGYPVLTSRGQASTVALYLVRPAFPQDQAPAILLSLENRTAARLVVAAEPLAAQGPRSTFSVTTSAAPEAKLRTPSPAVTLLAAFSIAEPSGALEAAPGGGVAPRHDIEAGEMQIARLPIPPLATETERLSILVKIADDAHRFEFAVVGAGN